MPKATLKFDLDKPEEREQYEITSKAWDLLVTLQDLDQFLRTAIKYPEEAKRNKKEQLKWDARLEAMEEIRSQLWDLAREREVNGLL
jgi:hypothetical protein